MRHNIDTEGAMSPYQKTNSKQEIVDIYKMTFYRQQQSSPKPKPDRKVQNQIKLNLKTKSVKEILQEQVRQKLQNILPTNRLSMPKVVTNEIQSALIPQRSSRQPQQKRYKSINLSKKFKYLNLRYEFPDTDYEQVKSSRQSFARDLHCREKSEFTCPKIEQVFSTRNHSNGKSFPKEFSSNILYKKYFA